MVRRGSRYDLPSNLGQGQIGFATDTGELFIGSPQLGMVSDSSSRNDGNIRFLTELDDLAQPKRFSSVLLEAGIPTQVVGFNNGIAFASVDYGLSDATNGAFMASTLSIAKTTINQKFFDSNIVTFSMDQMNGIPVLMAINNGSNVITISYLVRTIQSS